MKSYTHIADSNIYIYINLNKTKNINCCLYNNHNIDLRQVSSIHFGWLFVSEWENLITLRKAKCLNAGNLSYKAPPTNDHHQWATETETESEMEEYDSEQQQRQQQQKQRQPEWKMSFSLVSDHKQYYNYNDIFNWVLFRWLAGQMLSIMTHNQNHHFD